MQEKKTRLAHYAHSREKPPSMTLGLERWRMVISAG